MEFRDICIVIMCIIGCVSLIRIRITYMLRGTKIDAIVEGYTKYNDGYVPLMKFKYNGEEIVMQHKGAFKTEKYAIGTPLEIYYDPKNNKEVKIVKELTDVLYAAFFAVGAIFLVVASRYM